jgi:hypothetical protein
MPDHVAVHDFLDNMCLAAEEGLINPHRHR